MFQEVDPKEPLPKLEEKILEYWERENIFAQSVDRRRKGKKYVFFDGPPFANGLPHYGHIMANAIKDAVTRYWSMKGYWVPRRNGWDCHGLPVEYEIEKELEITGKKGIEDYGIAKFNERCRKSVFRYTKEWETLLKRIGRWVDFEDSYATLENDYMESIWWIFKKIYEKGLVYKGHKSMHICPRCETPLSNFEVTQGYKDVTDLSVYVKFKIKEGPLKNAFLLAWTTTPWTLPGNAALAIGQDMSYALIEKDGRKYIVAKELASKVCGGKEYKIKKELKAKDLAGLSYEPLFPFFEKSELPGLENAWRVYGADFVTTEDGTGIVHIAPAFGEDDMQLGIKHNIPLIKHVHYNGTFTDEVKPWAGKFVKGQDSNIAEELEKRGLIFRKENYRHSYPHCWRCDTPLLNYATDSWFIGVTEIKKKLVENNNKINWVPEHLKEGRFGKWLEGAKDWAISRNRFWGAPIPIWRCVTCAHETCIGSISELRQSSTNGNHLFVVRHGEADHNVKKILSCDPHRKHHLTKNGKNQAEDIAERLANLPDQRKIELIFTSPFLRTMETAEIIAKKLGDIPIETDERIREINSGELDGTGAKQFLKKAESSESPWDFRPQDGESFRDVEKRGIEFINYLNTHFQHKNILIVTHGSCVVALEKYFKNLPEGKSLLHATWGTPHDQIHQYYSGKIPTRQTDEGPALDLHKPYIDNIKLVCEQCGNNMERIPEVLDCWFESGAMPYAQLHYPFESKDEFEANFPAHFIAEGLDQTRGWFYTLHVLSSILFDKPAFKNVIVNGILLAADGEKLSKRKKNYPDPNELFNTFGVDSTRLFLYTSTAPLAEDVRFSETHVEDIFKRFTLTFWNTYSFFVTYANIDAWQPPKSIARFAPKNKLDAWILSELHSLTAEITTHMDKYNLTKATRPLIDFADNLSNWYIRRSRRRFWKSGNDKDKKDAYQTLYIVLTHTSRLLAPFMPFTAEAVYRNLTGEESVHFTDWPEPARRLIKKNLNREMQVIRKIVALGHKARSQAGIKVRQPLAKMHVAIPEGISKKTVESQRDVILEELNVKEIKMDKESVENAVRETCKPDPKKLGPKYGREVQQMLELARRGEYAIQADGKVKIGKWLLEDNEAEIGFEGKPGYCAAGENGIVVVLDTEITETLKKEGIVREIVRMIQEMRKEAGYNVADRIYVYIKSTGAVESAVTDFAEYIRKETLATELRQSGDLEWDLERTVELDGIKITLAIRTARERTAHSEHPAPPVRAK